MVGIMREWQWQGQWAEDGDETYSGRLRTQCSAYTNVGNEINNNASYRVLHVSETQLLFGRASTVIVHRHHAHDGEAGISRNPPSQSIGMRSYC